MITFNFAQTPITQIADSIIIDASNKGVSDIHFDPRENGLMVRFRIDGELVDYAYIPKVYERNLATRLKLMSGMNITESRLPQDGAIKGKFGGKDLDMRVASLPTNEGEKIVIRILDYTRSLSGLGNLGFNKKNYQKLVRMINNPNGIILVTGATGSGKSTTVYSILQVLNKEETNIITVEDPIEMNIEGMNQVQVNSDIGLDFAIVLRSILREDPNVILIGEIRDSETAQIAVRASITGHLVLSTIHTNNSLSTIERLLDMNVEKYLLSSAITGIISQRLAKKLCPKCRIKHEVSPYERKVFKLALDEDVKETYTANPKGCKECNKGYKGRIAIQEVLEIDDEIRAVINGTTSNKDNLRELVYGTGNVITLLQDALGKVLTGETSFEEVYRVIEIDNDINDSCLATGKDPEELKQLEKELEKEAERQRLEAERKIKEAERLKQEAERKKKLEEERKLREANKPITKLSMKELKEADHQVKIPLLAKSARIYSKDFFLTPRNKPEEEKKKDKISIKYSKSLIPKKDDKKPIKKKDNKRTRIIKEYSNDFYPSKYNKLTKKIDKKNITEFYNIKGRKIPKTLIEHIDYQKTIDELNKAYNIKPGSKKRRKTNITKNLNLLRNLDNLKETYGLQPSYILNRDLKYITPKITLNLKGKNKNKFKINIDDIVFKK